MEKNRDHRAHQAGDGHGHHQGHANAPRHGKGVEGRLPFDKQDIQPDAEEGDAAHQQAVTQTHPELLPHQHQPLLPRQLLVHQHPDGHSQGLCAGVAGHAQNCGLEKHNQRQLSQHLLKHPCHGGHHQAQAQQNQ